ncbi:MAG: SURF1 family protein [Burkholderiales bacterium]
MQPGPLRFPFAFRPRWWGVLLAALGCGAGILLGNWQSGRAEEKRAAGAAVQRIAVRGEFVPKYTVYLDNKLHRGRPGYHVVQPLRLAGGDEGKMRHVLVNRGWIAAGPRREQLPEVSTPAGEVALEGIRLERLPRAYAPAGARPEGRVWQNVTLEEFGAWSGLALQPFAIEQHSASSDGLVRDWPRAEAGFEKNEAYALQWYALAGLCVILLVVLSLRREPPAAR